MENTNLPNTRRSSAGEVIGFLMLSLTPLFWFAFLLKFLGIGYFVHMLYLFDQLLFDIGDLLILVCLPLLVLILSLIAVKRRKERKKVSLLLALAAAIVLMVNITAYAITDPIFEGRHESIYGE